MNHNRDTAQRGLTLLEVIVAIAILGLSLPAILRLVGSADAIAGHSSQVARATQLVRNETERLRFAARRHDPLNDTTYSVTRDGLELRLERKILNKEFGFFEVELKTREIQIDVLVDQKQLASYRLLQGYEY